MAPAAAGAVEAYRTFERGTPAGDALFRLYGGKKQMYSTVDEELLRRARELRLQREREAAGPKPKVQPKSRARVAVPRPTGRVGRADDSQASGYSFLPARPGKRLEPASRADLFAIQAERAAQPAPPRRHISEQDKDRLVQFMAHNGERPPSPPELPPVKPKPRQPPTELESLRELFAEVEQEVQERREFLADMRRAGQGKKYEAQIKAEVAERVQQLRSIDRMIREEEER
eukprot:TRINITY_DN7234_c0_g1_i1.p1 TRINITY_DN7234_c0_g1~~TRINITY_DN7234_c0_g1_i1.p1  ORF type:complete len:262 (+),score=101.88 TRINITY_DN7234_c0_g1_i1:95-787(+)